MNHPKFCNIFLVGPSQKKPFQTLGKWKMVFLFNKKNFLGQHCPCFQYACLCGIWIHSNKLCHVFVHNTRYFDRNPRMLGGDSSFLWTSFQQNCRIPSLLLLVDTRTYVMTAGEGLALLRVFLNFLEFFQPISGQSQDDRHDSS